MKDFHIKRGRPTPRWPRVHNRVLLVLVLGAVAAATGLAFVTVAPNRLVSGTGVSLWELAVAGPTGLWLAAVVIGVAISAAISAAAFLPSTRPIHGAVLVLATGLLWGWLWLAGHEAAARSANVAAPLTRVSLGGGFWVLGLLTWLAAADALQRCGLALHWRAVLHVAVVLPGVALVACGALDQLSLLKEYRQRDEVFHAAAARHVWIVFAALVSGLMVGLPLGLLAARGGRLAQPLMSVLNIIQTVPSIALLALLIAPLGALATLLPGWGIQGIGVWPAVVALTLYALLPIVHSTVAGLHQVPPAALQAGKGMGMTTRQLFWQVQLPLALPVWLAGLRTTTVQLIGLAVVAALIGAGGFGALVFQGLASSALDLVMLGVLPVVALALLADAGLAWLIAALPGPAP